VGVTIVRGSEATTARRGSARLIPAAETTTLLSEKQPDSTVLYPPEGIGRALQYTVFHETLGTTAGAGPGVALGDRAGEGGSFAAGAVEAR